MDKTQRRVILFRDVACIIGGLAGLAHQTVVATEANPVLIGAFVSLILAPTGAALWAQRNNGGQSTTNSSSGEQSSSSQQSSSP